MLLYPVFKPGFPFFYMKDQALKLALLYPSELNVIRIV